MHHIYVGRVTAHHNQQTGIWTKRASDVVFSQNTVYAHRIGVSALGACIGYQYGPERVWFLFNHLYDCEMGIMSGSDLEYGGPDGSEVHAIGNLIHDLVAGANGGSAYTNAGIMIAGSQAWTIANNTFWNTPVGVAWPHGGGALKIEGNVFGPFNLAAGSAIFAEQPTSSRPYTVTGNVFQNAFFRLGGYSSSYEISHFPGNQETDPLLQSPPSDFHLQPTSPSVDYSPLSTAYARFQTLYGFSIQMDFEGRTRPQGAAVDAGAFEWATIVPSTFFTVPPCRVLDTRNAAGPYGGPALAAGQSRVVTLTGRCGIPASARTITVNLTVTEPTALGHLTLYPANLPVPATSALNYRAAQTRANNAVVCLSPTGTLAIRSGQASGTAHVVLDVTGYFE